MDTIEKDLKKYEPMYFVFLMFLCKNLKNFGTK